jgi:hypothetical protein
MYSNSMGGNTSNVSEDHSTDLPKYLIANKKDIDTIWAELQLVYKGLVKDKHRVTVSFPTESSFVVSINDNEVCNRRVPTPVITSECKHKVVYGDRGEIKIKFKKKEPGWWKDRWSPRSERNPPAGPQPASESANALEPDKGPIVTEPDDE